MHDKEKRIRDQRLSEATRKGLTGFEGKLGTILKYLGHPIIAEGGSYYENNYMPDFYEIEDDEESLPVIDEDQTIMELGYIFDGLSNGMHLEIKYILDNQELTVYYEGIMVFSEIASELNCYVPSTNWETKIDFLFNIAKTRENKRREKHVANNKIESQRQKKSFLERLQTKWGI